MDRVRDPLVGVLLIGIMNLRDNSRLIEYSFICGWKCWEMRGKNSLLSYVLQMLAKLRKIRKLVNKERMNLS